MESSRNALGIPHDLFASLIDNYLPMEARGRLACVNKHLRESVAKHPVMYLARYIHAFKEQTPLPRVDKVEGKRVFHISKELAKRIARNDPGFRGYHQFLSENHDFQANPSLEGFVDCLLRDMRWVISSLARTAKNSKVRQIVENHQRAFDALSQADLDEQKINAIDWTKLYERASFINSHFQLKKLDYKVYQKFKDQAVVTFFGNKDFALYLLQKSQKVHNTSDVLTAMFREFPEMTEKDYSALMESNPHLFLLNYSFNDEVPFMRAVRNKHIEICNLLCNGKSEPVKDIPRAQTPQQFVQSLPLYVSFRHLLQNYESKIPFGDNMEVALALVKKFHEYQLPSQSPLWENQSFLLSFVRIKRFRVPFSLRTNLPFLNKLIAANPKMIDQFLQGDDSLYAQAVKSNPWIFSHFTEERQKPLLSLFVSLIPPYTLRD